LAALRPYKHILAAFLVAVYGFVAAPVQLWHHHMSETRPGAVSLDTKCDTVSQGSDSSEANCPVCSHKYSTYIDDALIPFAALLILLAAKNNWRPLQLVSIAAFHLPNKGPPVLS
jgi:hypothetical protein